MEDYDLEWTTTCAECLGKAKEATEKKLLKHEIEQPAEQFDFRLLDILILAVILIAILLGVHHCERRVRRDRESATRESISGCKEDGVHHEGWRDQEWI